MWLRSDFLCDTGEHFNSELNSLFFFVTGGKHFFHMAKEIKEFDLSEYISGPWKQSHCFCNHLITFHPCAKYKTILTIGWPHFCHLAYAPFFSSRQTGHRGGARFATGECIFVRWKWNDCFLQIIVELDTENGFWNQIITFLLCRRDDNPSQLNKQ